MNTYYTKNGDGTYQEVTFPIKSLIEMLVESYTKDAVFNATAMINEKISNLVDDVVAPMVNDKVRPAVDEHLGTFNIADIVNDHVDQAVRDYDYGSIVEEAAGDVNIEEIVEEKVRDHLDSCCIQVRIS